METTYEQADKLHRLLQQLENTSHEHRCAACAPFIREGSAGKLKINYRLRNTRAKLRAQLMEINKEFRAMERAERALRVEAI